MITFEFKPDQMAKTRQLILPVAHPDQVAENRHLNLFVAQAHQVAKFAI